MLPTRSYFYVQHIPRQTLHALPVRSIGFEPDKRHWIDSQGPWSESIGIHFIVQGTGTFFEHGKRWPIHGPCVLLRWPGRHYHYGPHHTWEEFYVSYTTKQLSAFDTPGWQYLTAPVIPLGHANSLSQRGQEIAQLCANLNDFGSVDRIDALVAILLGEILVAARQVHTAEVEVRIQAARAWVDVHLHEGITLDALAKQFQFSSRTFRRYWQQRFGVTLTEYMHSQRIHMACDLLVTTNLTMTEIANRTGFFDQCYFSHRFRNTIGIPPSQYRKRHRLHIATDLEQPLETLCR